ncbi:MAG: MFS transporter [Solirubrobacteraceae bacterium]
MNSSMAAPPLSTPQNITGEHWDARVWGTLVVLCGVILLDGLDVSMVGVALPSIRSDLHLSTSSLQWVVSGYVLGYGGLLLLGGRAADLLGRRRVFLIALAAFTVASLLGGLTSDGTLLIVTRFLKGASAAFTAPAGLSIITTRFAEGPARNRALSIYTACGASGFSLGLVMGGVLTEIGWRWTFFLPVPIALAILFAARRLIPHDTAPERQRGGYDLAGAVTITASMLLLVATVVEAPTVGWGTARTLASFAAVAALLAAFLTIERRSPHPLIRLGILRAAALARANVIAMAVFGGYVGFQFIGTLYLQSLNGWSALETALAFLPAGLLVAAGAPRIGPVVQRYGTGRVIATGMAAFVAGYALFLRIGATPSYGALLLPTVLLIGIGFALSFPSLNIQATAGVADHEQGLASGLVNTSFQLGGAIVLAVVTAVIGSGAASHSPSAVVAAFRPGLAVVTGIAAAGLLVALGGVFVKQVTADDAGAEQPETPAERERDCERAEAAVALAEFGL